MTNATEARELATDEYAAIAAHLRERHATGGDGECGECGYDWPCPNVRAADILEAL